MYKENKHKQLFLFFWQITYEFASTYIPYIYRVSDFPDFEGHSGPIKAADTPLFKGQI